MGAREQDSVAGVERLFPSVQLLGREEVVGFHVFFLVSRVWRASLRLRGELRALRSYKAFYSFTLEQILTSGLLSLVSMLKSKSNGTLCCFKQDWYLVGCSGPLRKKPTYVSLLTDLQIYWHGLVSCLYNEPVNKAPSPTPQTKRENQSDSFPFARGARKIFPAVLDFRKSWKKVVMGRPNYCIEEPLLQGLLSFPAER